MTTLIDTAKLSPMMAQWHACKVQAKDAILLFRLGEFYEAFYEDAQLIAKELDLTLTKRQEIPMAGVPVHTAETYVDRLVAKGYRVAIAEQMGDPKATKGIVPREIVRTITPGTLITSSLLSDKSNNFIAAVTRINSLYGLSFLDITTADFRALQLENKKELLNELARLQPAELIVSEKIGTSDIGLVEEIKSCISASLAVKDSSLFNERSALERLLKQFHITTLDSLGFKEMSAAICAAGGLLAYLSDELQLSLPHIATLRCETLSQYMSLDKATQQHLELKALLDYLDHTVTPMGGRLLKQWVTHPLLHVGMIHQRQEAIAELLHHPDQMERVSNCSRGVRDLERLMMRIETGYASPRDLLSLKNSLQQIGPLQEYLTPLNSSLIREQKKELKDLKSLIEQLDRAIVEDPPFRLSEGKVFKRGYHQGLDELYSLKTDSHTWMASYQAKLREESQIKTLKVGYTNAFGYYIEVSRGQSDKVPLFFQRRQTLVNAERFSTPELKEYEYKILTAEEKIRVLENELFQLLREQVAIHAAEVRQIATAVGCIDCLCSLSLLAQKQHYCCPQVNEGATIQIREGRHPVVEAVLPSGTFIPNDVLLDDQKQRLILITGPNMAGKSTFIRQVALLVIMAQMGSFIPATAAQIGIVDKVFTRIGASDDLARGQSTFMVEMTETANILHNTTERSLVILDEIGRGTSTYDGVSIAWAVAEYLLTKKGKRARTLFATHYGELTQLEQKLTGAVNYNVLVSESEQGILFLHKIAKGSANKSYGIHVAKLAGLPPEVLKRAQNILSSLEKKKEKIKTEMQLDLFSIPTC